MKKKIFVIAGHSKASPGALAYNGKTEHEYTTELQALIASGASDCELFSGTSMEIKTDNERMSNAEVRNKINTMATTGSLGVDIHFNNNNVSASGTEVIVSQNTSVDNMNRARRIAKRISECLGIKHRRRVPGRDFIYPSETHVKSLPILDSTKIPMILIEVCFLNQYDLPVYQLKKNEVAKIIREELLK